MPPREIHILIAIAAIIGTFVGFFVGLRLGSIWALEYAFKKLDEER